MSLDRFVESERETVVHQAVSGPQAPERRSPYLVRGLGEFRQGLDRDAITGAITSADVSLVRSNVGHSLS